MTIETYLLLAHSVTVLLALVAVFSFYNFPKAKTHIRLIGLYGLAGCLVNLITMFIANMRWTAYINIPGSIHDFVFIVILSALYNDQTMSKHRQYFTVAASIYIILGVLNLFFVQQEEIASYAKLLGSIIIVTYAITYFYRLMVDLPTLEVHRLPMFWFNSAFLIFHAGTVFLFAFTSYLVHVLKDNLLIYYSFHNVLSIIENAIIIVGLLFNMRTTRETLAT
jgi:hypothetical protein